MWVDWSMFLQYLKTWGALAYVFVCSPIMYIAAMVDELKKQRRR